MADTSPGTGRESIPTIILCGGRGTRISEVNPLIPKPLLPIGNKLKGMSAQEAELRTMTLEGILSIQAGDNPRVVADKLLSFIPPAAIRGLLSRLSRLAERRKASTAAVEQVRESVSV